MASINSYWQPKSIHETELIGPFECPACGFHIGIDFTFLDQVSNIIRCPGCGKNARVKVKDQEGMSGQRLSWPCQPCGKKELINTCRDVLLREDIADDEIGDMIREAIKKATNLATTSPSPKPGK